MRWERLCVRKEFGGMGFKDLYGFNLAMMGKLGWQLLSDDTSLMARILKTKYFSQGDLLLANLGSNPSLTWRSIHEARLVVKQGYRWKVGDGKSIKVWEEPWVRQDGNMRISSLSPIEGWDLRVSSLLLPNGEGWDEGRVNSLFHPHEAADVLAMSVTGSRDDCIVWHHSKSGNYTVRSAYRMLLDASETMVSLGVAREWRELWQLDIPPKIKHFAWRVARGVLATRDNLQRRHVNVPRHCGGCAFSIENTWNLLLGCPFATECWQEVGLAHIIDKHMDRSESWEEWPVMVMKEEVKPNVQQDHRSDVGIVEGVQCEGVDIRSTNNSRCGARSGNGAHKVEDHSST
ncbi:Putative ribonuclease H protein At1g65750 [Linum grandiflorum]